MPDDSNYFRGALHALARDLLHRISRYLCCPKARLAWSRVGASGDARQLTPLFREQRLRFGHAGSSKFVDNRTLAVTPAVSDARLSNKTKLFSAYGILGKPRLPSAANEVNRRILQKIAH